MPVYNGVNLDFSSGFGGGTADDQRARIVAELVRNRTMTVDQARSLVDQIFSDYNNFVTQRNQNSLKTKNQIGNMMGPKSPGSAPLLTPSPGNNATLEDYAAMQRVWYNGQYISKEMYNLIKAGEAARKANPDAYKPYIDPMIAVRLREENARALALQEQKRQEGIKAWEKERADWLAGQAARNAALDKAPPVVDPSVAEQALKVKEAMAAWNAWNEKQGGNNPQENNMALTSGGMQNVTQLPAGMLDWYNKNYRGGQNPLTDTDLLTMLNSGSQSWSNDWMNKYNSSSAASATSPATSTTTSPTTTTTAPVLTPTSSTVSVTPKTTTPTGITFNLGTGTQTGTTGTTTTPATTTPSTTSNAPVLPPTTPTSTTPVTPSGTTTPSTTSTTTTPTAPALTPTTTTGSFYSNTGESQPWIDWAKIDPNGLQVKRDPLIPASLYPTTNPEGTGAGPIYHPGPDGNLPPGGAVSKLDYPGSNYKDRTGLEYMPTVVGDQGTALYNQYRNLPSGGTMNPGTGIVNQTKVVGGSGFDPANSAPWLQPKPTTFAASSPGGTLPPWIIERNKKARAQGVQL